MDEVYLNFRIYKKRFIENTNYAMLVQMHPKYCTSKGIVKFGKLTKLVQQALTITGAVIFMNVGCFTCSVFRDRQE